MGWIRRLILLSIGILEAFEAAHRLPAGAMLVNDGPGSAVSIEERPNRMHESFEALTLEAILQAWPCRK